MASNATKLVTTNVLITGRDSKLMNVTIAKLAATSSLSLFSLQKFVPTVRVATTAAGTLATSFANGQTVDGIVLATNDRILIKNQASSIENGVYVVQASGAPVRSIDSNSDAGIRGQNVYVSAGSTNALAVFTNTNNSTITIGTTGITYGAFSGTAFYIVDGNGGNHLDLSIPVNGALYATITGTAQYNVIFN